MRSSPNGKGTGPRAARSLKLAALGGLLFLHIPLGLILLYAFTTEDKSYQFPPPGLTLKWFAVAWGRQDIWDALALSLRVAATSTAIAMILGSLAAAALSRSRFFGRESVSLLIILPIALPGIITGISLRAAFSLGDPPIAIRVEAERYFDVGEKDETGQADVDFYSLGLSYNF